VPRPLVRALSVLSLSLLVAAVYGRTLGHGFVFDDQMLVLENPIVVLPPSRALDALTRVGGGYSYRPIRVISYQLDHWIAGGLHPAVFHASNVLWHLAAVLVLLGLARATIGSEAGALTAAALFAVHPLGSEAVAYVAGRRDLLATLFTLLALRAWWWFLDLGRDRARPPRARSRSAWLRRRAVALSLVLAAAGLAVGSKETALVLPGVAMIFALAHRRAQGADAVPVSAWLAGLVLAGLAVAAAAVGFYPDRIAPLLARAGEPSLAPQPALSITVVGRYLGLALWPARLSADYRAGAFALPTAPVDGASLITALGLAVVMAAGAWLVWRGSAAGAGLLWFLLCLLPVAQVLPYGEVLAEHNAYLGLPGLALAAGAGVAAAARRRPRAAYAVAIALVAGLAARCVTRVADWRDNVTLWTATLEIAPSSQRARYNLGVALVEEGKLVEGREALRTALDMAPPDRDVLLALAGVETRLGDYERAIELAQRALSQRRDGAGLIALGWAQLGLGDAAGAVASFEASLALGGPEQARQGLAQALRRQRP
jgi:protein O-mannosyl-transferase